MTNIVRTYWIERLVKGKAVLQQVVQEHALFVGSLTINGLHAPLFDLDFGVVRESNVIAFRKGVDEKDWRGVVRQLAQAGLISAASVSAIGSRISNPQLSFAVQFSLRESSTHGHFHLLVEKEIPWVAYRRILESMCRAGLIGPKYLAFCTKDKMAMLIRPPLTKEQARNHPSYEGIEEQFQGSS